MEMPRNHRPLHEKVLFRECLLPLVLPANLHGMAGRTGTAGKSVLPMVLTGEDANLGAHRIAPQIRIVAKVEVAVEATIRTGIADVVLFPLGNPQPAHGTLREETTVTVSFCALSWSYPSSLALKPCLQLYLCAAVLHRVFLAS